MPLYDESVRQLKNVIQARDSDAMPRSPLRRPPQHLNFQRFLLEEKSLPERVDSTSLFGNSAPLEIEVGSGKGLFLTNVATAQPHKNFLGIEIATKFAEHIAARLAKADLVNARVVSGNAEPIFAKLIEPNSLEAVHVYFPDPWWKARHRKRRVVNETSIVNYSRAIRSGGRLHFWTDVLDYFEETIEMIADLAPELGVPIPEDAAVATHDLDYRTHFERRSRQHSIPVYRVVYEKS